MHGLQLLHQNAQAYIKGLDTFKVQTSEGTKSIHGNSQSHAEQRAKSMGYKLIK